MKTPTVPRTEAFPCDGPCELDLRIREGRIEVKAGDVDHVRVELSTPDDQTDERSVGETRVEYSEEHRKLVVRAPRSFHRGGVVVFVEMPSGSKVEAAAHRGSISASGKLCGLVAITGGGAVEAEEIDGAVKVASGSGSVTLGRISGPLKARLGNGDIELSSIESLGASLTTGHGDVRLGVVGGNAKVRTGKGSVVVSEVAGGNLDARHRRRRPAGRRAARRGRGARRRLRFRPGPQRARRNRPTGAGRPGRAHPHAHGLGRGGRGELRLAQGRLRR